MHGELWNRQSADRACGKHGTGGNDCACVASAKLETGKGRRAAFAGRLRTPGKERIARGELEGNDNPQALWVFSTDACGVYGIEHLNILHAGRTDPVGKIVLASETRNVKLKNGDGLLLSVNAASHD